MDIKHIDTGLNWIDRIYHVSDVHIRTLKRHKEYWLHYIQLIEVKQYIVIANFPIYCCG